MYFLKIYNINEDIYRKGTLEQGRDCLAVSELTWSYETLASCWVPPVLHTSVTSAVLVILHAVKLRDCL